VAGWHVANTGAVAGALAEAYGTELPVVGLLTTALFLTHFAVQVPGGKLIDRVGARRLGLAALALIVAANALALAEPSLALALVARTLMGFGTGAAFVAGSDAVRAVDPSPTLQGIYGGMSMAGGGLAIALVPPIEGAWGWRAPYASAIVVAAAVVPMLALAGRRRAARVSSSTPAGVVRDRRLYQFAILHTASFGLGVVLGNWVVTLLVDEGYDRELAGAVGAATLLGGLVTRPLGGWAIRRYPARAGDIVASSFVLAAFGTFGLASGGPLPVLAAASVVLGLAVGAPFALAFTGAQRLRPDAPAAAIGVVNGVATLAIVVGTPLLGLTFSLPGGGRLGFALAGLLVLATPFFAHPRAAAAKLV
jgi:MFS transporter, NNP family, nitrate/nitrite transporter